MNKDKVLISWILTSRDDGYSGNTVRRLNVTIASILALDKDSEIVVVDFCPEGKLLKDSLSYLPVKFVTVNRGLLKLLQEESKSDMSFYEYLAKDIGSKKASGDKFIFCNPDNIFPSTNFDEVKKDIEAGFIVRAMRLEIPEDCLELDNEALINAANKDEFVVMNRFSTAGGDFTGMNKEIYEKLGGYYLAHGSWHLDNLILAKAGLNGYEISSPYSHFHINHINSVVNNEVLAEREKEGFNTDWQNFKPISKKILDRIDEFIQ